MMAAQSAMTVRTATFPQTLITAETLSTVSNAAKCLHKCQQIFLYSLIVRLSSKFVITSSMQIALDVFVHYNYQQPPFDGHYTGQPALVMAPPVNN